MEEQSAEGNRGFPIQQTTELEQMNLTLSAKFALLPRGRSVSRLAWIPRTFVPYVGAGGGYGSYTFRQNGDFVDFSDNHDLHRHVPFGRLVAHRARAGRHRHPRVSPHRCCRSKGNIRGSTPTSSQDFIDFEPIDLGGFRFGVGIHFAF